MKYSASVPPLGTATASSRPRTPNIAVERAVGAAGHVADDVGHRQQVLAIARLLAQRGLHLHQLGERHARAVGAAHGHREQRVEPALLLRRQRDAHRHAVLRLPVVQRGHVVAGERRAQRGDDLGGRHAGERRLALVDAHQRARRVVLDRVVDADDRPAVAANAARRFFATACRPASSGP